MPPLTFPRHMRLSRGGDFLAVRNRGVRVNAGPLLVYGLPTALKHPRLGLGVSTRAGNAVRRNAIKRRLREAFRLGWRDWPEAVKAGDHGDAKPQAAEGDGGTASSGGYDVVISVRAHEPLKVEAYQQLLLTAVRELDVTWRKKSRQRQSRSGD